MLIQELHNSITTYILSHPVLTYHARDTPKEPSLARTSFQPEILLGNSTKVQVTNSCFGPSTGVTAVGVITPGVQLRLQVGAKPAWQKPETSLRNQPQKPASETRLAETSLAETSFPPAGRPIKEPLKNDPKPPRERSLDPEDRARDEAASAEERQLGRNRSAELLRLTLGRSWGWPLRGCGSRLVGWFGWLAWLVEWLLKRLVEWSVECLVGLVGLTGGWTGGLTGGRTGGLVCLG